MSNCQSKKDTVNLSSAEFTQNVVKVNFLPQYIMVFSEDVFYFQSGVITPFLNR